MKTENTILNNYFNKKIDNLKRNCIVSCLIILVGYLYLILK